METQGKVALVTGAGMGIGKAIAIRLAAEGAAVVVNDIDDASGRQTAQEVSAAGGRAAFIQADVANESDVQKMIVFTGETFGGLDILVNNAAPPVVPPFFPQSDTGRWRRTLEICLVGTMLTIQHALPAMGKRGGGAIVNLSSQAGIGFGRHDAPEYAAAKAGIVRLTGTLASLAERVNVRVNCICPNWVATEKVLALVTHLTPEMRASWHCPELDKMAQPEDIADAVVWLVRDETGAGRTMLYDAAGERTLVPPDSWPV